MVLYFIALSSSKLKFNLFVFTYFICKRHDFGFAMKIASFEHIIVFVEQGTDGDR